MIIDLRSVLECDGGSLPLDCGLDLSEIDGALHDVRVVGSLSNRTGICALEYRVSFAYDTECARCGKEFVYRDELSVRHLLIKSLSNDCDNEDDLYIVVPDMRLDLDAQASEEIFLSLPSRFLCNHDCKGLCPICGCDLNERLCGCKKEVDPRLATLADLLKN